jgi:hypothetical protein
VHVDRPVARQAALKICRLFAACEDKINPVKAK